MKKSTLATWCRQVELTEEQYTAIRLRTGSREGIPRDTNRKRRAEIYRLKFDARSHVPGLVSDPIWAAGAVLNWAKGAKTRNHLVMANADPRALRPFVRWIRTYLEPDAEFSFQLPRCMATSHGVGRLPG